MLWGLKLRHKSAILISCYTLCKRQEGKGLRLNSLRGKQKDREVSWTSRQNFYKGKIAKSYKGLSRKVAEKKKHRIADYWTWGWWWPILCPCPNSSTWSFTQKGLRSSSFVRSGLQFFRCDIYWRNLKTYSQVPWLAKRTLSTAYISSHSYNLWLQNNIEQNHQRGKTHGAV